MALSLLIRAVAQRVLFGFWRGRRLQQIESRLKPGGKYEIATLEPRKGDAVHTETVTALVTAAIRLNAELSDPTKLG